MPLSLAVTTPGPAHLYLVRHGRTVFNAEGLMQGWSDSPLTADGLDQVRARARTLAATPFAAAFASPSPRAVTTAREILRYHPGVPLETEEGLREMHFGAFESRPQHEAFAAVDPRQLFGEVFAGTYAGMPGSAETAAEYLERVGAAFGRIERSRSDGAPVLVVGHGVTLLAYLCTVAGTELPPLDNAALAVVDIDRSGRRLVRTTGPEAAAGALA